MRYRKNILSTYRRIKQRKNERLRGKNMLDKDSSDMQKLLHWMEATDSGPCGAVSHVLLSKQQSSYQTEVMYHYLHNEKPIKAKEDLLNLLSEEFPYGLSFGDDEFIILNRLEQVLGAVDLGEYATYLHVRPKGTKAAVQSTIDLLHKTGRTKKQPLVTRIYKGQYGFDCLELTLPKVTAPNNSNAFYPFIKETPKEMWDNFAASSSNVLLFIGDPGVGKTNYIRQMLDARGYDNSVHLVDNEALLMDPELMGYIQSGADISLLVTEDADRFVAKREDENISMVGLLNASSGLAGGRVKFIISTNLAHLKSVDEALIRPGRCFKVVQFHKLTPKEATIARHEAGLTFREFSGNVTLAEALNDENKDSKLMKGIGFN